MDNNHNDGVNNDGARQYNVIKCSRPQRFLRATSTIERSHRTEYRRAVTLRAISYHREKTGVNNRRCPFTIKTRCKSRFAYSLRASTRRLHVNQIVRSQLCVEAHIAIRTYTYTYIYVCTLIRCRAHCLDRGPRQFIPLQVLQVLEALEKPGLSERSISTVRRKGSGVS